MVKISVIIPIYNTAKYLKECIDSVLNQSFTDIEVICVNDGSTDSSPDVLKTYESNDHRIKIINQENKGLGAARNIAMTEAQGEYIIFLDSDDYMAEEAFVELYDIMESKSLDVLIYKIINFDNETYEETRSSYLEMNFLKKIVADNVFNWKIIKNRLFDMSVTAPGKMFRRDLIQNITFPEGLIFEDNLFFMKMIFKAKRIYFLDEYFYYRRLRDDSITSSSFSQFPDCIPIYDSVGEHLKQIGKYDEFAEQLFNRKCKDVFTRFSNVPDEYKQGFYEDIKENFSQKKKSLEREGTLKICTERSLEIFNSAINTNTYREFELSINLFDLKRDFDKLKLDKNLDKRQYERKLAKLNETNKDYQDEIEELKSSTSWRVTKLFRVVTGFFKRLID